MSENGYQHPFQNAYNYESKNFFLRINISCLNVVVCVPNKSADTGDKGNGVFYQ